MRHLCFACKLPRSSGLQSCFNSQHGKLHGYLVVMLTSLSLIQVAQRPAQGTQQWNQQPQAPPAQPQWASQQPPAPSQGGWPQQSHQQQSGYASQQHDQAGLFPPAPAYAGMSQGQGAAGGYPSHGTPQVFIPQAPAASSAGPPPPPSHVSNTPCSILHCNKLPICLVFATMTNR